MMKSYHCPSGSILVNLTGHVDFGDLSPDDVKQIRRSLKLISKFEKGGELPEEVSKAIDLVIDSGVILPADYFVVGHAAKANRRVAEAFVKRTSFGLSLFETLSLHGIMALLNKRLGWQRDTLQGKLMKALATITMMLSGVDDAVLIPKQAVLDTLQYFRTSDNLRWRPGMLGSEEMSVTCFREITRAFGNLYEDDSFWLLAKQTRVTHSDGASWKFIEANPTVLQQELIENHKKFSVVSGGPLIDRDFIRDLDKMITHFGYDSLESVLRNGLPEKSVYNYYLKRCEGRMTRRVVNLMKQALAFSSFVCGVLAEEKPGRTYVPLLTQKDWLLAVNNAGNRLAKPSQAVARALPERYHFLAKQILDEGETGWPGRTFQYNCLEDGLWVKRYCPVVPTLLRAALELPLRMVQFRRLDSGEGDERRFNGAKMEWEVNDTPNAGYWVKLKLAKKGETRGYAFRFPGDESEITGFFVNTNKTGAPYTIPWMSAELHGMLWDLAQWQVANNPIEIPISPELYKDQDLPAATLARLPDIFALFRMPPSAKTPDKGKPPSTGLVNNAFLELILEIERRWNEHHPESPVSLGLRYSRNGQPTSCSYTLHGLRVRGITNLYRAGVSIEILSKMIAGHATVAMTLYYLLFEPAVLNRILNDAMDTATSAPVAAFADELRNMQLEEARRRTTYISETALEAALQTSDKNQFCNVDIGICPFDGTRCGDGGELLRSDNLKSGPSKSVYGPVPGGPRNCIMCRHFISGTPFILQLELFGTLLLWKRSTLAREQRAHRERLNELIRQKQEGVINGGTFRGASDRLRAENNDLKDRIADVDNAIFNTKVHLEAASKILREDEVQGRRSGYALVASGSDGVVEYTEQEPFDVAAVLSGASRVWTILKDEGLENTKRQFIDQIMFNAGETPISMRADLTMDQRQASTDALAQFLIERVSAAERKALTSGEAQLRDLKIDQQVASLLEAVRVAPIREVRFASTRHLELTEGAL